MSIEFPKFRYHRTLAAVIVDSPEQEQDLGDGWADTPAAFDAPEPEPEVQKPAKKK